MWGKLKRHEFTRQPARAVHRYDPALLPALSDATIGDFLWRLAESRRDQLERGETLVQPAGRLSHFDPGAVEARIADAVGR